MRNIFKNRPLVEKPKNQKKFKIPNLLLGVALSAITQFTPKVNADTRTDSVKYFSSLETVAPGVYAGLNSVEDGVVTKANLETYLNNKVKTNTIGIKVTGTDGKKYLVNPIKNKNTNNPLIIPNDQVQAVADIQKNNIDGIVEQKKSEILKKALKDNNIITKTVLENAIEEASRNKYNEAKIPLKNELTKLNIVNNPISKDSNIINYEKSTNFEQDSQPVNPKVDTYNDSENETITNLGKGLLGFGSLLAVILTVSGIRGYIKQRQQKKTNNEEESKTMQIQGPIGITNDTNPDENQQPNPLHQKTIDNNNHTVLEVNSSYIDIDPESDDQGVNNFAENASESPSVPLVAQMSGNTQLHSRECVEASEFNSANEILQYFLDLKSLGISSILKYQEPKIIKNLDTIVESKRNLLDGIKNDTEAKEHALDNLRYLMSYSFSSENNEIIQGKISEIINYLSINETKTQYSMNGVEATNFTEANQITMYIQDVQKLAISKDNNIDSSEAPQLILNLEIIINSKKSLLDVIKNDSNLKQKLISTLTSLLTCRLDIKQADNIKGYFTAILNFINEVNEETTYRQEALPSLSLIPLESEGAESKFSKVIKETDLSEIREVNSLLNYQSDLIKSLKIENTITGSNIFDDLEYLFTNKKELFKSDRNKTVLITFNLTEIKQHIKDSDQTKGQLSLYIYDIINYTRSK
jgi:hypothetical protein